MSTETKKTTELAKIKVSTDSTRGFEVFIQSQYGFAPLFAEKNGTGRNFTLGGQKCHCSRSGDGSSIDGVNGYFSQANIFEYENFPNLSLLLAINLKEGVTFNFGVFPISQDKVNAFAARLTEQIKMIYLAYMKPVSVQVSISTATIENEEHN